MKISTLSLVVALLFSSILLNSQGKFDPAFGCITDPNDQCLPNTLLTAVPFLRITPDARSSGMGEVGLATSKDANAMFHNTSKLAFIENETGISASYAPWLKQLGLSDVNLLNISGYKKINDIQSFGLDLKFFTLGEINFTDFNGNPIGTGKPRETAITFGYARKLSSNFSTGLNLKYISSNLASGLISGGLDIATGKSFAADISLTYMKEIRNNELTIGAALSNLGNSISYTNSVIRDVIPANFGIGSTYTLNLDNYNSLSFSLDLNKLMVPTPIASRIADGTSRGAPNPEFDKDGNGIGDYRERGIVRGMLMSFYDAQGGLSEELKEIEYSFGMEYWYDQQFAVRAGYYHQSFLKGDRKYLTVGLGINYNVFGLDLSYLVPTNNRRNPLDNTLRFSFNLALEAFNKS